MLVDGFGAEAVSVRCGGCSRSGDGVPKGIVGICRYGLSTGVGEVGNVAIAIVVVVPGGVAGDVFSEQEPSYSACSLGATAQINSPGQNGL